MAAKSIVLCADGTGNVFGAAEPSNVARLVTLLALDPQQVVAYDQGIGTPHSAGRSVVTFRAALDECSRPSLVALAPPPVWARPFTLATQTFGWGLTANVLQLYVALTALQDPHDHVFLFGFSRGAFTVRALAGMVWRYGLPIGRDEASARTRFAKAWRLFRAEFPDHSGEKARTAHAFRADGRECPFHFLGLWDTVKSYGGLKPIILPHLRHNPAVAVVRHALSLDERRAWYEPTTWGRLDLDRQDGNAMSRVAPEDLCRIEHQDVREVWFSGTHSDVGGGSLAKDTAAIALRWMLSEATATTPPLRLNDEGGRFLRQEPARVVPAVSDSYSSRWAIADRIPRATIVNESTWPCLSRARPGPSPREPWKSARRGRVYIHDSVSRLVPFPKDSSVEIERVSTQTALGSG